jgi:hypothetical protein
MFMVRGTRRRRVSGALAKAYVADGAHAPLWARAVPFKLRAMSRGYLLFRRLLG